MKQALTLKIGQQLTMTPQLQQAIRLLQLSTLELELEVQQAIETNPMLELDEDDDLDAELDPDDNDALADVEPDVDPPEAGDDDDFDEIDFDASDFEVDASLQDPDDAVDQAEGEVWEPSIPEELAVDSSWDDTFQASAPAGAPPPEDFDTEDNRSASETLTDHLMWQLNLTPMTDRDRMIAIAIIDEIDADGMLRCSAEDILLTFAAGEADEDPIELDEVEAVLKRVQQFDPAGVAARDPAECLLIQLRQLPADTHWRSEAIALIEDHIDVLAARDFAGLMRRTKLDEDALRCVVELIRSLNPRPGSAIGDPDTEYIEPDVIVRKVKGRWTVELNPRTTPKLRINGDYACLVRRADTSAENTFLRNNLQEARWFLKSLQSRSETLLKVAMQIVEHQHGFLDYGDEAMKPLVLADIAQAVEMHESTISRVTTRKYMDTPRGIFELKYFFSSHVGTATGGEVSSTAIRALIKKLTAEENPRKPLSDSKIAAILGQQSIKVARRTVAKYRESMSIPPSNERKRLV